jgi:hypothetical protein
VAHRIQGTKRPRRLEKAGIQAIDLWLASLRESLEKNYDRLDEILAAMKPERKEGTR